MRKAMSDRDRENIRKSIIEATKSIVEEEGFKGISIRKVSKLVGYTEGSIYNYFRDKDALVHTLLEEGYQNILEAIKQDVGPVSKVEEEIRKRFKNYTYEALKYPKYYKAIMISEKIEILGMTCIIKEDLEVERDTIKTLQKLIERGIEKEEFCELDSNTTAKLIWTSVFGLIIRIMVEGEKDWIYIESLVERQFDLLFGGLRKRVD